MTKNKPTGKCTVTAEDGTKTTTVVPVCSYEPENLEEEYEPMAEDDSERFTF